MNNIVRVLIGLFACVIMLTLMTARTKTVTTNWSEDELSYALRVATQDATSVLMDEDNSLDGNTVDAQNINVNLNRARRQFEKSFEKNIGSHVDPNTINNMNIPLIGYVGYKYIIAQTYDGSPTFPYAYTTVKGNTMYNFTLNSNTVYVTVGHGEEEEKKLDSFPEHFFSDNMTNEEFRTYTIMEAINKFLTIYNGNDVNIIAQSMGGTIQFALGAANYSQDPAIMTKFSAIVDGPGFFALTDILSPQVSGIPIRVFTFGGSELLSKY